MATGEYLPACRGCGGSIRTDNNTGYCSVKPGCNRKRHKIKNQRRGAIGSRQRYRRENPDAQMWSSAKARAVEAGVPFSITREDIRAVMTGTCPVFGKPIAVAVGGRKHAHSPWSLSLDRIDPAKGYVPGNIQVLSQKANAMKSDATPEELLQFAAWIQATYGAPEGGG